MGESGMGGKQLGSLRGQAASFNSFPRTDLVWRPVTKHPGHS